MPIPMEYGDNSYGTKRYNAYRTQDRAYRTKNTTQDRAYRTKNTNIVWHFFVLFVIYCKRMRFFCVVIATIVIVVVLVLLLLKLLYCKITTAVYSSILTIIVSKST